MKQIIYILLCLSTNAIFLDSSFAIDKPSVMCSKLLSSWDFLKSKNNGFAWQAAPSARALLEPGGGLCGSTCVVNIVQLAQKSLGHTLFKAPQVNLRNLIENYKQATGIDGGRRDGLRSDHIAELLDILIKQSQLSQELRVELFTTSQPTNARFPNSGTHIGLENINHDDPMILIIGGTKSDGTLSVRAHAVVGFRISQNPLTLKLIDPLMPQGYEEASVMREVLINNHKMVQVNVPYVNFAEFDDTFIRGVIRLRR